MKRTRRAAAGAILVVLLAAPVASFAQTSGRQTPLPEIRQQQFAPFSEPLRCVWTRSQIGNAWTGAIIRKDLSARNTLNHVLPAGTHLTWSYSRGATGLMGESGELDLTAPVPQGRVVATGAAFTVGAHETGRGLGQVRTCQIQVSYNMGRQ